MCVHVCKTNNTCIRGCKVTQFYGYTREGDGGPLYDNDCLDHTYFISTQETGFELSMLKKFDAELLIGQVSYKQKATIYNITNGYDDAKKIREVRDCKGQDVHSDKLSGNVSEACRVYFSCLCTQFA